MKKIVNFLTAGRTIVVVVLVFVAVLLLAKFGAISVNWTVLNLIGAFYFGFLFVYFMREIYKQLED